VKGNERQSNDGSNSAVSTLAVRTRQHRPAIYQKVRDERKRAIRGLWVSDLVAEL
jgi:hypothetical protein